MNAADRADRALYASQDCGGSGAMRARGNIAARLEAGNQPRMRDVIALEDAARMGGNDLADDDWEPAMYTQSQLDAVVARALAKVSAFWFVACLIVVYVALTGVH